MRRALSLLVLAATVVSLSACKDDTPKTCAAAEGATATCDQACAKLFELDCRIAASVEDCVTACVASSAALDPAVSGRVKACYAQAGSCSEVDGCSLTCGPGGGPVPFIPTDAGAAIDAGDGTDAGPDATDAGVADDAGSDAGGADDAGSPGSDAGAPAADAG